MTDTPLQLDTARELTILAWRRTILRLVLVAVVAARLFTEQFGALVIAVALVTIVSAAVLNLAATREFSQVSSGSGLPAPTLPGTLRRPTPRLAITAAGTLLLGLVSLWWVLKG